jgi:hypothetical protein
MKRADTVVLTSFVLGLGFVALGVTHAFDASSHLLVGGYTLLGVPWLIVGSYFLWFPARVERGTEPITNDDFEVTALLVVTAIVVGIVGLSASRAFL